MKRVILSSLLLVVSLCQGHRFKAEDFTVVQEYEARNSYITFLVSQDQKRYVLKQKKALSSTSDRLTIALDALGCHLAEALGIPCNHVSIIPAEDEFIGKKFIDQPASLHTFIPGNATRHGGPYKDISIVQWRRTNREFRGLRMTVVSSMSRHPDLPALCALDTFVGNSDRCCENVRYAEDTDHFYAFDYSDAFKSNLCKYTIYQVQQMKYNGSFGTDEKESLIAYKDALEKLIKRYPPEKMLRLLDHYMKQALNPGEYEGIMGAYYRFKFKLKFRGFYRHAQMLVKELDELILEW